MSRPPSRPARNQRIEQEVSSALSRETDRLARLRFFWWTGVILGLTVLAYGVAIVVELMGIAPSDAHSVLDSGLGQWLTVAGVLLLLIAGIIYVARTKPSSRRVGWIAVWLIVINHVGASVIMAILSPEALVKTASISILTHALACVLLPWTPFQALVPVLVFLPVHELLTMTLAAGDLGHWGMQNVNAPNMALGALAAIGADCLYYLPGVAISCLRELWRRHRFRTRFISDRYTDVRRELSDARLLHESLFPARRENGPVRVNYVYEPMRDIGGDFLHLHDTGDATSVLVVDVTGHGVSAALTVNRLHREIDRLYAVEPEASPGRVIEQLNTFIYSSLSGLSMYASAVCCRVDAARGTLEYASAGHPPIVVLRAAGGSEWLDSTALVLGAVSGSMYTVDQQMRPIRAGDTIVLFTDGLIEARNEQGRMIGLAGLRDIVEGARPRAGWCEQLRAKAASHRAREAEDDMLVVEVTVAP